MDRIVFTLRHRKNRAVLLAAIMALGIWTAVFVQRAVNADASAAQGGSGAIIHEAPAQRNAPTPGGIRAVS
jgi:hypothetical protein